MPLLVCKKEVTEHETVTTIVTDKMPLFANVDDDVVIKWMVRVLATVVIAVACHVLVSSSSSSSSSSRSNNKHEDLVFDGTGDEATAKQINDDWDKMHKDRRSKWLEAIEQNNHEKEEEVKCGNGDDAAGHGDKHHESETNLVPDAKHNNDKAVVETTNTTTDEAAMNRTDSPPAIREEEVPTAQSNGCEKTKAPEATPTTSPADKKKGKRGGNGPSTPQEPPPITMSSRTNDHPGMGPFMSWYNVETSLYRIYAIGRADGTMEEAPPFFPGSERGQVNVELQVVNATSGKIDVFWINYKGQEDKRGTIKPNQTWNQTTWMGHPWTFRNHENGKLLLHYIPYKIAPTTLEVPTVSQDDDAVGLYTFTITDESSSTETEDTPACGVIDPIFPTKFLNKTDAVEWTLQHMARLEQQQSMTSGTSSQLLTKYLTNIVMNPEEVKYRKIRIANPKFNAQVWNTPARGILLACGFVEQQAYAELGSVEPFPKDRIQDISLILFRLEQWSRQQQEQYSSVLAQPEGADGYGRAGYGRPGQLNFGI